MTVLLETMQAVFGLWMLSLTAFIVFSSMVFGFVIHRLKIRAQKYQLIWAEAFFTSVSGPFYLILVALWLQNLLIVLPKPLQAVIPSYDQVLEVFMPIVFAIVLMTLFNKYLSTLQSKIVQIEHNHKFPNAGAWLTACKLGRLISVIVFAMVTLNIFNVPIGQLLAPTAVGALALSFASKDILSNVFGGLMVMCDRPFVVGNYVSIRQGEEGTVRAIGWRTTEIQLQNGRILHVPNGVLTTTMVTNFSEKSHWFVQKEFGLRYRDIDQAKEVAEKVEAWVSSHTLANRRRAHFAKVYQLSDSAVVIRVRVYLKNSITTKDWYQFNEDLIYQVSDVVKACHADFAFPTRTIYNEA
ncbi:mechanosensitive ion channel family protein [Gammaproteobacteria bacterium]|nr:mechanosensitive ion channel family protein [Gammaproteobacteria bacterium]